MAGTERLTHTPGPWRVDVREAAPLRVLATDARATIVASDLGNAHSSTAMADARLIAAAPDLLTALKALHLQALQSTVNDPGNEYGQEALAMADAAIAKAEGET